MFQYLKYLSFLLNKTIQDSQAYFVIITYTKKHKIMKGYRGSKHCIVLFFFLQNDKHSEIAFSLIKIAMLLKASKILNKKFLFARVNLKSIYYIYQFSLYNLFNSLLKLITFVSFIRNRNEDINDEKYHSMYKIISTFLVILLYSVL